MRIRGTATKVAALGKPSSPPARGTRIALEGLFALVVAVGATCAWRGFAGQPLRAPRVVEFAAWLVYFGALGLRLGRGSAGAPRGLSAVTPAIALLLGLHAFIVFRLPCWLGDESSAEAVSRAARGLSATAFGWPLTGLAYAWGLCLVAWLGGDAARQAAAKRLDETPAQSAWPARVAGWFVLIWTLGFGTLAVLGYATGSSWLLPE